MIKNIKIENNISHGKIKDNDGKTKKKHKNKNLKLS